MPERDIFIYSLFQIVVQEYQKLTIHKLIKFVCFLTTIGKKIQIPTTLGKKIQILNF